MLVIETFVNRAVVARLEPKAPRDGSHPKVNLAKVAGGVGGHIAESPVYMSVDEKPQSSLGDLQDLLEHKDIQQGPTCYT